MYYENFHLNLRMKILGFEKRIKKLYAKFKIYFFNENSESVDCFLGIRSLGLTLLNINY